jgi:hypothetical protein
MLTTATPRRFIVTAVIVLMTLSACVNGGTPRASVVPSQIPDQPTTVPTPVPTATPVAPAVIYFPAAGADASRVTAVRDVLQELANKSGVKVEERSSLAKADLKPAWKLVVAVLPDAHFGELAAAAPKIQFVAIDGKDLKPSANLTLISAQPDQQAFLAGLIAALATPDWRVGVLGRTDHPADQTLAQAFLNGARYLCGICNPLSPPYPGYPVYVEVAGDANWQDGLTTLAQKGVATVYLPPEMQNADILLALVNAKMHFVSGAPAGVPQDLRSQMVASVSIDPLQALRAAWPDLIAGKSNSASSSALVVSDVQGSLLTSGRMRLVDEARLSLGSGVIYPLDVQVK